MLYLILSVLSTVWLFVVFRKFDAYGINRPQAITFNYLVCVLTGLAFHGHPLKEVQAIGEAGLLWLALGVGAAFVSTFLLVSKCVSESGIPATSVATKMSMVVPICANLFFFDFGGTGFGPLNYVGLALALCAVFLVSAPPTDDPGSFKLKTMKIPAILFVLTGSLDTLMNHTGDLLANDEQKAVFTILLFGAALIWGSGLVIYRIFAKGDKFEPKNMIAGLLLGVPNYFSILFILLALGAFQNNGALVFPLANIGTILISGLVSVIVFKDKMSKANKIGMLVSLLAICLISY